VLVQGRTVPKRSRFFTVGIYFEGTERDMGSFSIWRWLIVLIMLALPVAAVVAVVLFVNFRRRGG